jgi:hypothetical protein
MGFRLMADNGSLLQSLSDVVEGEAAVAFGFTAGGGTCDLLLVAVEAKKALSSDADGVSV